MSYTLTIDAPRRVMTRVMKSSSRSADELGRLFVAFLTSQYLTTQEGSEIEDPVSRVMGCIKTKKTSNQLVREIRTRGGA